MDLFSYQCLSFRCRALTPMALPRHKGATFRGALFGALRGDFCLAPRAGPCLDCRIRQACPVCSLLATADDESPRGIEVARPCTIEPPLGPEEHFPPGSPFSFGLTLFGDAAALLPYIVLGVQRMGESGIGNRSIAAGRFKVETISAFDPVTGKATPIYEEGDSVVTQAPASPTAGLWELAQKRPISSVSLDLLTPTRLINEGRLVKTITFPVLMRRLLRRASDIARTATGASPVFDYAGLLDLAEGVEVQDDRTRWLDLSSYSSRQGRSTPIGGLVGSLAFRGDLAPFLPWVLLGAVCHVGKDATKGNGMYRVRWDSGQFPLPLGEG